MAQPSSALAPGDAAFANATLGHGLVREDMHAASGATREEIREVFMQVANYCGVPAGVDAFRNAKEVFAELDKT